MSDQTTPTTREMSVIIADRDEAVKAVEALDPKAPKADREAAEARVTEVNAELKQAKRNILFAALAQKEAAYNTADTAGKKAALRRDMNNLRKKLGLPEQIAGSKSSGPRFDDAVLALLESDEDLSE